MWCPRNPATFSSPVPFAIPSQAHGRPLQVLHIDMSSSSWPISMLLVQIKAEGTDKDNTTFGCKWVGWSHHLSSDDFTKYIIYWRANAWLASSLNLTTHAAPYHISRLCGLNLPTIRSCLIRFPPSHTPDSLLLRFALAVLMKFPLSLRYVSVASVDTLSGMSCPFESRCGGGGLGLS